MGILIPDNTAKSNLYQESSFAESSNAILISHDLVSTAWQIDARMERFLL